MILRSGFVRRRAKEFFTGFSLELSIAESAQYRYLAVVALKLAAVPVSLPRP